MTEKWYQDYREVISFAEVLNQADEFSTPEDVIYFFEKPWKWTPEYISWKEEQSNE